MNPRTLIQLYNFGFSPRPIHLAAGRPVTLTFVNRSGPLRNYRAETCTLGDSRRPVIRS